MEKEGPFCLPHSVTFQPPGPTETPRAWLAVRGKLISIIFEPLANKTQNTQKAILKIHEFLLLGIYAGLDSKLRSSL